MVASEPVPLPYGTAAQTQFHSRRKAMGSVVLIAVGLCVFALIIAAALVSSGPSETELDTKVIIIRESALRKNFEKKHDHSALKVDSPRYTSSLADHDSYDKPADDVSDYDNLAADPTDDRDPELSFPNARMASDDTTALAGLKGAYDKAKKQALLVHSAPAESDVRVDPYDKDYSYPTQDLDEAGDLWRKPDDGDCGLGNNC
mmetsp:Transcript_35087/g.80016  ORF Transcript_35087/g.80016 Transcript_35087/m.80016 type:complete len:203 (-) Transcript_35087:99-707(-)